MKTLLIIAIYRTGNKIGDNVDYKITLYGHLDGPIEYIREIQHSGNYHTMIDNCYDEFQRYFKTDRSNITLIEQLINANFLGI